MTALRLVSSCLLGLRLCSAVDQQFDWTVLHLRVAELLQSGNSAESVGLLERAITGARQRGEAGAGLAEALNDLGTLYHDSGRFVEADRAYKESLFHWARTQVTSPKMATALTNLAGLRLIQGRPAEAEKLYGEAERILIAAYGVKSPHLAAVLCGLADVYWETRRYEDARDASERALKVLENTSQDSRTGVALCMLAQIVWKQNREGDAEGLLRRAIEVWRKSLGTQHPTYASGLTSLAVLLSRRDPNEAMRLFRESLELVETHLGPDHVFAGYTLVLYARHLEAVGRKPEGKRLKRRGEAILAKHSRENLLGHTLDISAFQLR
jgi:tetratricopeptide (TPR) repeat protein